MLEAMQDQLKTRLECRLFSTGASFELGDVLVETFSVPHDAQDPVGFLLRTPEGNAGFLTDLGHATKLVLERVRHANVLVLEANHDVRMFEDVRTGLGALNNASSAWPLVQRGGSRRRRGTNQPHPPARRPRCERGWRSARASLVRICLSLENSRCIVPY